METEYDYARASLAGESETEAELIQHKCFEDSCAGLPDDRFKQMALGRVETSKLRNAPKDVFEQRRRVPDTDLATLACALSSAADQIEGVTDAERKTLKEIQESLVHGDLPKFCELTQGKMNEAELARLAKLLEQTFAKVGVNARFFVDDYYRHYPIEDRQGPVLKMYWSPHEFSDDDGARLPIPTYVLAVGKDFTDVMVCLYGGEGIRPIGGDVKRLVQAMASKFVEAQSGGLKTRRSPIVQEPPDHRSSGRVSEPALPPRMEPSARSDSTTGSSNGLRRLTRPAAPAPTESREPRTGISKDVPEEVNWVPFTGKIASQEGPYKGALDTGESYRVSAKDLGNGNYEWTKAMSSPLGDKLSLTFTEKPKVPTNCPGTDRQAFIAEKWEYTTPDGGKVTWNKSAVVIKHADGKEEAFPAEILLTEGIRLGEGVVIYAKQGGVLTDLSFYIRGKGFGIHFSAPLQEPNQDGYGGSPYRPHVYIKRNMQIIDGKLQPAESSNIQVRDSF